MLAFTEEGAGERGGGGGVQAGGGMLQAGLHQVFLW